MNTNYYNLSKIKICSGCGVPKQDQHSKGPGYVNSLEHKFCLRCYELRFHNSNINSDLSGYNFLNYIKTVIKNHPQATFIYVLDIVDILGSRNLELERLLVNKQVVLVINKIDLIIKLISVDKIINYIKNEFLNLNLLIKTVILISGFKNYGLDELNQLIASSRNEIIFLGSTNSGKSTLINKLLKLNQMEPILTVSPHQGTTLNLVGKKFNNNVDVYDTPGLINASSLYNNLNNKRNWVISWKNPIKPVTFQLNSKQSILINNIIAFSYVSGNDNLGFHIYINNLLPLHRTSLLKSADVLSKELNYSATEIDHQGLSDYHTIMITLTPQNYTQMLSIAGLGWITIPKFNNSIKIALTLPFNVEITLSKNVLI